jgi:membrane-bound serine protease (ClpP class)
MGYIYSIQEISFSSFLISSFRSQLFNRILIVSLLFLMALPLNASKIVQLSINPSIAPVTADYIDRSISNAQNAVYIPNQLTLIQNNQKRTLNTVNVPIEVVNHDWRSRFLSLITNPTVAYFLMLLGLYGIFFELASPGYLLPGVAGAVALLLAFYAFQLLPVNYAGLGLIVLGVAFIVAEVFMPSYGSLGIGGTVAFILGSIFLMDTENANYHIAWSAIWGMAVFNIIIFMIILRLVVRARGRSVKHGLSIMVGAHGRALGEINLEGQALIRGEIWSVHSEIPIASDHNVKVIGTTGLLLEVEEDYCQDKK